MPGIKGMVKTAPMHAQQDRARLWQAMRMLRSFTQGDLVATAEASANHVCKYLSALVRAEYLRVVQPRRSGVAGGEAHYRLLRDTGPLAPRIGKSGLLDPNLTPARPEPGDEPVTLKRRDYERALLCVRACAGLTEAELYARAGLPLPSGEGRGEGASAASEAAQ